MPSLLLELFSEEIPARMQAPAAEQLSSAVRAGLGQLGYTTEAAQVQSFVSPRHLAVRVRDLPARQADVTTKRKGPRANAPQAALDGFLRSTGLALDQLELRGDTYFATLESKGRATAEALPPMLTELLAQFNWPKSMRWGTGTKSWVRPLHGILAMLDGDILPVRWGDIQASNTTYGHRFLAPGAIALAHPDEYETKLKSADVWVDAEARQAAVRAALEAHAAALGLSLNQDEALLREVNGLVEFPAVLAGRIDAEYMTLPPEVLISEMKEHQRYFALSHADGSLADAFLIATNMDPARMADGGAAVVAGNERVLRARLADGRFFWDQDRKMSLDLWARKLDGVVYHAKLGSMAERVTRLAALAKHLAPKVGADAVMAERAAHLAKADLPSGMVGEFPDLQGIMGRYYARDSEAREVAEAIGEHYKPVGPSDSVPTAPVSVAVALADKLDVLAGMFTLGEKPTGSKDPFALRRMALGVIRLLIQNRLHLPLNAVLAVAVDHAYNQAAASERVLLARRSAAKIAAPANAHMLRVEAVETDFSKARAGETQAALLAFIHDRLKVLLRDEGVRHDVVDAVLAPEADDLTDIAERAHALHGLLVSPQGANLLAGTKRAANILRAEEKKDKRDYNLHPRRQVCTLPEEIALFEALAQLEPTMKTQMAARDYTGAMESLAGLRAPVDAFFEAVLVNDPNQEVRANRLALLSQLRAQMRPIADFDALQG